MTLMMEIFDIGDTITFGNVRQRKSFIYHVVNRQSTNYLCYMVNWGWEFNTTIKGVSLTRMVLIEKYNKNFDTKWTL